MQAEHYTMRRIKARMKAIGFLHLFFGGHAANVVLLAERSEKQMQVIAIYQDAS